MRGINVIIFGPDLPCYFLLLFNDKFRCGQVAIIVPDVQCVCEVRCVEDGDLIVAEPKLRESVEVVDCLVFYRPDV
jgi:hypothetical protein